MNEKKEGRDPHMMPATELAAIEASVSWGRPMETDIANHRVIKLVAEIRRLEGEIFALRDGLRSWQETAKDAELRAAKAAGFEAIVSEVSGVVDEFDRTIEGTLAERVRKAIGGPGQADD